MAMSFVDAGGSLKARAQAAGGVVLTWAIRQPLFRMAMLVAVLIAAMDLIREPARLSTVLGDTDDATRLTEVRQLLAGQSWFDMSLPRFGGNDPLISHWSRLFDLPLAGFIVAFSTILSPANAELAARMAWPTLLSGVILFIVARFSEYIATRKTALLALVIAAPAVGHCQFLPGRIDHHSGMIIGAIGGTFLLLAALDRPRLGWLAGVFLGLGCAIGYEGLGLTVAVLSITSLTVIASNDDLGGPARAAAAFAATLAIAHVGFGPYRPDGAVMCDALSSNLVILAVMGAFGVAIAHMAASQGASRPVVVAWAAAFAATGLALYVVSQPACLRGPYGQLDPRLSPIWLDNVLEVQSVAMFFRISLVSGLVATSYLPLALAYGAILLLMGRIPRIRLYFGIYVAAMLFGLWQIRLLPYAGFLAVPLIAVGLHRDRSNDATVALRALTDRQKAMAGAAIAALVAASVFVVQSRPTASLVPVDTTTGKSESETAANNCFSADHIAPLAALARGLVVNDMDLGPYIVAVTGLNVMAAPYHRLGPSILAVHDFMNASAAEAVPRMKLMGARYVVLCRAVGTTMPIGPVPADALRAALLAGRTPTGLEAVELGPTPLKVWRLKDE